MGVALVGVGALVAAGAGLLGVVVVRRSREIARRVAAVEADPLEPPGDRTPLVLATATLLGTRLLLPPGLGSTAALPGVLDGVRGSLVVDDLASTFSSDAGDFLVPHARVYEAALLAEEAGVTSAEGRRLLRLTWARGGERIATSFSVAGRRVDAERLRREIHVRAGKGIPVPKLPAEP